MNRADLCVVAHVGDNTGVDLTVGNDNIYGIDVPEGCLQNRTHLI